MLIDNYSIFNYKDKHVYVTGDIHGNFTSLIHYFKERQIKDAIVIVAGDIGIGFEKIEHYHHIYMGELSKYLDNNNVDLLCVRGNHDNPLYFNDSSMVINEKRWKTIPDYSIVKIYNGFDDVDVYDNLLPTKSILCIGGATSIDRTQRLRWYNKSVLDNKKYGSHIKEFYWPDEQPFYNENILNSIKNDGIIIDDVITHTCPSFSYPITKDGVKMWMMIDDSLSNDLDKEREVMDNIYYHLREDKHPITNWIYGHYHNSNIEYHDSTRFVLLNCIDFKFDLLKIV